MSEPSEALFDRLLTIARETCDEVECYPEGTARRFAEEVAALGTFRVVARDLAGDFGLVHRPCGLMPLVTQNVSVETLVRLAAEHECPATQEPA